MTEASPDQRAIYDWLGLVIARLGGGGGKEGGREEGWREGGGEEGGRLEGEWGREREEILTVLS